MLVAPWASWMFCFCAIPRAVSAATAVLNVVTAPIAAIAASQGEGVVHEHLHLPHRGQKSILHCIHRTTSYRPLVVGGDPTVAWWDAVRFGRVPGLVAGIVE